MAAKLEAAVLDGGLDVLNTTVTHIYICSTEPTTYAEASSTFALGNKNWGAGNAFGNPAAAGSGRKVSSVAITDGTVTTGGTASWWAATDGSALYAHGAITTPLAVATVFTLTSFDVTIPSGA